MRRTRHVVSTRRAKVHRGGTLSMELVLVLPILMTMLLGMAEFAMLFYARGQVIHAAQAGARLATLHGVDEFAIEREVKKTLPIAYANATQVNCRLGKHSGDDVVVTASLPMQQTCPDLLWPIGYSLSGRKIVAESRMRKE